MDQLLQQANAGSSPIRSLPRLWMYRRKACVLDSPDDEELGLGFESGCWWVDAEHTLCSNPSCLARVPLAEIEKLSGIGK